MSNHNASHWCAMKGVLAYLNGIIYYGIEYRSGGSDSGLVGFSDADFAGNIETRRSTTGYVFYLSNGSVTWSSHRQKLVTLSTTDSEYVVAEAASREAVWLRGLLKSLGRECDGATVIRGQSEYDKARKKCGFISAQSILIFGITR